ncbi:MAG: adenosylcobinamide-GDP ribazoletransferase [Dehalococcoidia bacterium]|nr:adenosylcobinamide-GDP ribazoletransferase [Dehalococcoidia bacterium]
MSSSLTRWLPSTRLACQGLLPRFISWTTPFESHFDRLRTSIRASPWINLRTGLDVGYFLDAWRFLTSIPIPLASRATPPELGPSLKYFSLVGLVLGLLWAISDWTFRQVFPMPVATALLLAVQAITTGALHLDGLADTCDGVFLSGGPARRLEVMRDSRIGVFGAVGLVTVLLIKYSAFVSLSAEPRFVVIIGIGAISRWAIGVAVQSYPYAREHGLGTSFKMGAGPIDVIISSTVAISAAFLLFGPWGILVAAWAGLWLWISASFILSRLPGLTGDTYGAISEVVEIAVLLLLVGLLHTGLFPAV